MTARRQALNVAIARLREVLKQPETDVSRDAAIQRFEFCFELAWKAIQERAREEAWIASLPEGACESHLRPRGSRTNRDGWQCWGIATRPRTPTMKI